MELQPDVRIDVPCRPWLVARDGIPLRPESDTHVRSPTQKVAGLRPVSRHLVNANFDAHSTRVPDITPPLWILRGRSRAQRAGLVDDSVAGVRREGVGTRRSNRAGGVIGVVLTSGARGV